MVGPGTGLAPFVGFIEERTYLSGKTRDKPMIFHGPTYLFFGCRRARSDFIFRDLMFKAVNAGVISNLHLAFSREVDTTTDWSKVFGSNRIFKDEQKTCYVQDKLKEVRETLEWLCQDEKAYVFICGNTAMGADVHNMLKEWLGEEFVQKMEQDGRLVKELWSS